MRAREGDGIAREELVKENIPLVHYVLKRFRDRNAEYEDMFQYGCMGLLKAIDRFDPSYAVQFSTYAVPVIMGEVRRSLRDNRTVHVSRAIHDNALRVQRFREEFIQDHSREPDMRELSEGTGLSAEDALLALNANYRVMSLSEPVGGEGEMRLMDVLGMDCMAEVDKRLMVSSLLRDLLPEERMIIIRRYFRRHTQTEIARDMGISQVQVSRLEGKILKRMRARAE